MATAIFMIMFVYLVFAIALWIGTLNHGKLNSLDLMAGGEGID